MGVERRRSRSLVLFHRRHQQQPGRHCRHEPPLLRLCCPLLLNPPCQWATGAEKFPGQLCERGNQPRLMPPPAGRQAQAIHEDRHSLAVVTVKFTENTVEGLSTHTINSIRANKAAKTLSMEIHVPKATARGLYHMQGVLGPLELDESLAPAPYTTSFTGTTVSGVAKMDVVNGKLKIVQDPDVTINVEGLNVQMENLFGGEADGLAKVVLRFVNKESDKFIKDFQPEIAKQVSNLIKTFFNSALDNIPVNTFE